MRTTYVTRSRRIVFIVLCVAIALAAWGEAAAAASSPPITGYPNSIASTGDSITRAFNTGLIPFTDAPGNSWSTGTDSTVNSHYSRILAANPSISGNNYNDAVTGSKMADLNAQVAAAISQNAAYVTILIGANDACTNTPAEMTPVATFRSQFETAMSTLTLGLPDARIYVLSIPSIYNLWSILKDNRSARLTWALLGICQSMLARPLSNRPADVNRRNYVNRRVVDYNTQLASVCAEYIHCRFDNNAVYNTVFTPDDVNTRDYFHPSLSGQALLASVSWEAGFDFTDQTPPVSTATTTPVPGGLKVLLTAADNVGVSGIEYMIGVSTWARYTAPVFLPTGSTMTFRAVDVNGNSEASQTITAR